MLLDTFETPYVDAQNLLAGLRDFTNPRDWIARAVKKGELIRLKNGFFLISSRFRRNKDYPYEQLGNLLYGPSYISLEWALSFYNIIPERVAVVTSVTTGANKQYETPIGTFLYRHLHLKRYYTGSTYKQIEGQLGGFLIATPEKALVDLVHFTSKGLNKKELLEDLLDAKRIEKETLQSLNKQLLNDISEKYKSSSVKLLNEVVKEL